MMNRFGDFRELWKSLSSGIVNQLFCDYDDVSITTLIVDHCEEKVRLDAENTFPLAHLLRGRQGDDSDDTDN